MSSFMAGFAMCAVLAGLIWGYRAWLAKKADNLEAQLKQSAQDVTDNVKAKLP